MYDAQFFFVILYCCFDKMLFKMFKWLHFAPPPEFAEKCQRNIMKCLKKDLFLFVFSV